MMTSNQFDHGLDPALLQDNSELSSASEHSSGSSAKTWRSQLGVDFRPSEYSVICGKGKASYDHAGNHRLRMLTSMFLEKYAMTDCKRHKSSIALDIVVMTRKSGGCFCKYEQGAWFEVGDHFAREKVSAMFRDMLHTQYRSSAKAKTARRRVQIKRKKARAQQHSHQLIKATEHRDDSPLSSTFSGSSTDSLGFDYLLKPDSLLSLSMLGGSTDSLGFDDLLEPDFSLSSYLLKGSTDSLGFDYSLDPDVFDIDIVF
jgi:hypothetical protein